MTVHRAMVFAAGRGRRMAPLTDRLPKPMIPVAGRPLIDHALAELTRSGIGRAVINTHYLPDPLRAHLSGVTSVAIALSHEPELLETGGGLKAALPLLDGAATAITLNSDAVWRGPPPISHLLAAWDPAAMDALLLLVERDRAVGHDGPGDFRADAWGRLSRRGDAATAPLVYTGAQIVKTAGLAQIPDRVFSLNRLWDGMLAEGRLFGVVWTGRWADVGRPDCIPLAEAMLA